MPFAAFYLCFTHCSRSSHDVICTPSHSVARYTPFPDRMGLCEQNIQQLKQNSMSSQFKKFKALHQADNLFVLPNVWNAKSAVVFQEKQFQAVGTSSAAVASSLGYEDGEQMQFL